MGALFLMCSFSAFSQEELKGKVSDFLTFMPIESASVYVDGSTTGTITNADGKFSLRVPKELVNDTLVISSIGYKSYRVLVSEFDPAMDISLEEDTASLDEVLIVAETRPKTGNDIVLRAIEKLEDNLPEQPYLQKGFLRHKERNTKEYKWLIESAITLYDSSYASGAKKNLKINVDETRKSYDLREVDSLYAYYTYLKYTIPGFNTKSKALKRDTIKTQTLIDAIRWNDTRTNGLDLLFRGRLNLVRNAVDKGAIFGKDVLASHHFKLDTVQVINDRKIYKIAISKGVDFVGLDTDGVYNEGFEPNGWIYIYWDSFAIKKIEYNLVAASAKQKARSKSLLGTYENHKLVITYMEYQDKMYPNYMYYETPKLLNLGDRSSDAWQKTKEQLAKEKEEQFYYAVQEILFTDIIQEPELIAEALANKEWNEDVFLPRPYNEEFWENYNVLLESEEEDKLIKDLSRRASLFKE
ncbi:hypothetical protein SCB49_01202 [unidentified eubacterium SCB49]|nr:hypothetical protein SCB49_01202 [unidentified eubacterium SCB49]